MIDALINSALFLAAFAMMEGVAYVTHKHVMHGFLWCLHQSHHLPREGLFEKNDLFAFWFALPSILLIYLGVNVYAPLLYVGLGMTAYGFAYFVFHDGIVHNRMGFRYKAKRPYMKRIIQAHWVHHASREKEGGVSFGFLVARPVKAYEAERRHLAAATTGKRAAA